MSKGDPTDHALATIASILDHPETQRAPEKAAVEEKSDTAAPLEADGYFKVGPGPMPEIRFKWTVRRAKNDEYYVDETIGENSKPVVSGPLTREAAIQFVDEHEREARRRFEQLKGEMAVRAATMNIPRRDGGEL